MDSLCGIYAPGAPPTAGLIAAARQSGITAIHNTISDDTEDPFENLDELAQAVASYPDALTIIRKHSDIARAKRENKLGIIKGFQQTSAFENRLESIETFRKRDVRIMQLTYNKRNALGDGCLESANAGLTKAGIAAVQQMNHVGVAIDLSHSGYRTTAEAIVTSSKPVLVTHSGCASLHSHPRNKPDDILRSLADHGGYFGVYLMPYLVASATVPTKQHVLDHIVHAINVCGADHVGIGNDGGMAKIVSNPAHKAQLEADVARRQQLGVAAPEEDRFPYVPDLSGPDHMLIIAEELSRRGQPSSAIDSILGGSFNRVLRDIRGET